MPLNLNLPKKSGLFIAGTDIDVGKTLIAGAIARILVEQGVKAGVFKPIGTGCRRQWDGLVSGDADFLAGCANSELAVSVINPVAYLTDASPFICAEREGKTIDFGSIAEAYRAMCENSEFVIVEGVGGVREPLTEEFDLLDLAVEFDLPVVIVAGAKPGTVNHTLMTIDCVKAAKLRIAGVVINGYDAREETVAGNTAGVLIAQFGGVNILSEVPFDETVDIEQSYPGDFVIDALSECDWVRLAQYK